MGRGEEPGEGVTGVSRHNSMHSIRTNKQKSRKIEFKIQKIKKIQK